MRLGRTIVENSEGLKPLSLLIYSPTEADLLFRTNLNRKIYRARHNARITLI
jgi:hypothetical protein